MNQHGPARPPKDRLRPTLRQKPVSSLGSSLPLTPSGTQLYPRYAVSQHKTGYYTRVLTISISAIRPNRQACIFRRARLHRLGLKLPVVSVYHVFIFGHGSFGVPCCGRIATCREARSSSNTTNGAFVSTKMSSAATGLWIERNPSEYWHQSPRNIPPRL